MGKIERQVRLAGCSLTGKFGQGSVLQVGVGRTVRKGASRCGMLSDR